MQESNIKQATSKALLAVRFNLDFCLACYSTLKMEAIFFSEISVGFKRSTRQYIPEDRSLLK
jgi:hypothetical protein